MNLILRKVSVALRKSRNASIKFSFYFIRIIIIIVTLRNV